MPLNRLIAGGAAVLAVALGPARARAQNEGADHPIHGVRPTRTWLADSVVRRRCPDAVLRAPNPPDADRDAAVIESWCAVDTTYRLPNADGTRWLGAEYARFVAYPADSALRAITGKTRDTVRIHTAVLYTWRDHVLEWSPEWMGTVNHEYMRWIGVATAPRPDRSMLASITYCVNGTGGCWQRYLRRLNARWTEVKEHFWSEVAAVGGGRIGKGPGIDVVTLAGSYGVYAPDDANCCPSRELHLQLAQRGDSLVLVSQRIRPVSP